MVTTLHPGYYIKLTFISLNIRKTFTLVLPDTCSPTIAASKWIIVFKIITIPPIILTLIARPLRVAGTFIGTYTISVPVTDIRIIVRNAPAGTGMLCFTISPGISFKTIAIILCYTNAVSAAIYRKTP